MSVHYFQISFMTVFLGRYRAIVVHGDVIYFPKAVTNTFLSVYFSQVYLCKVCPGYASAELSELILFLKNNNSVMIRLGAIPVP